MLRRKIYLLAMGAVLANAAVAQFWSAEKAAYQSTANCPDCQVASAEAGNLPFPEDDKESLKQIQDLIGKDISKEMNGFSRPDAASDIPAIVQAMASKQLTAEAPKNEIPAGGYSPIMVRDNSFIAPKYPQLPSSLVDQLKRYYKDELAFARPGSLPAYFGTSYGPSSMTSRNFFSGQRSFASGPTSGGFGRRW